MKRKVFKNAASALLAALILLPLGATPASAAHPLITDDTGTQGTAHFQVELNTEIIRDEETSGPANEEFNGGVFETVLSVGVNDETDVVVTAPYSWGELERNDVVVADDSGLEDVSVELKWRGFEYEGLSLALKPGITLPTGDEDNGFGTGEVNYSIALIATEERENWLFHGNLAYTYYDYKLSSDDAALEESVWFASFATEYLINEAFRVVGDIGIEKNQSRAADEDPAFVTLGAIYSPSDKIDLDLGIRTGITKPADDMAFLFGLALRM